MTLVLVAANLAVAFFAPFSPMTANFAFDPFKPNLLSALTCLFLHDPSNILHLLGNMVFLAAVGPLVESSLGPTKFLVVYLVGGLAGVAGHWIVAASTGVAVPLIGASSAIAACVGYCGVRYMLRKVHLAPKLRMTVGSVAVVWVMLQAVGAFVKIGDAAGTSFVAHIGGFVGGLALAFVFRAPKQESAERGREMIEEMAGRSPAAALAAAEEHLRAHPEDLSAVWDKADALRAMGEHAREADVLIALVRLRERTDLAVERLAESGQIGRLPALERMRLVAELQGEARLLLLHSVVREDDDEPERPHALLALAEAAEHEERQRLLKELSEKYELHAATELARARGLLQ